MSKLTRVMAAVARALAWLLPAGRRDWVAAVWAEAHEARRDWPGWPGGPAGPGCSRGRR